MTIYDYSVELDVDDDRTYSNGLCKLEGITSIEWQAGMGAPYGKVANPAYLRMTLLDSDGRYDLDDENSDYYGLIAPGRLIRVRTTYKGTTVTMTELRITDVMETFGEFIVTPGLTITAMDKMKALLSFEYFPELQTDVTTDEPLTKIHETAQVVWPNNRSYFFIDQDEIDGSQYIYDLDDIDFDTGRTSLAYVGDNLGQSGEQGNAQRLIRQMMDAEVFGLYYFNPRDGKYYFKNRHHAINTASSYTFRTDGDYIVGAETSRGRNPYGVGPLNTLTLDFKPRKLGNPASVIYENDKLPIEIKRGETKTIRARYFDPDNDDARVGATDILFEKGVDIDVNQTELGTLEDVTFRVPITIEKNASQATITVTNDTNFNNIWIRTLQIRGTPLISYQKEEVTAQNAESFYQYDVFEAHERIPIDDADTAQAIADMMVNLFGTPKKVVERLVMQVSEAIADVCQTLTIGDSITVQNADETHNQRYIVVSENHMVQVADGRHYARYVLRDADIVSIFHIDESEIDGPHVIDF